MADIIQSPSILLPRFLNLRHTGSAGTQLHSALLRLRQPQISSAEVTSATYGTDTKRAVEEFQRRNFDPNAAKVTGQVDQDTGSLLLELLRNEEPNVEYPSVYFLFGHVVYKDGANASELAIEVFDRGLRPELDIKVSKTPITTDSRGHFRFEVSRQDLKRSEGTAPSFALRVLKEGEILYQSSLEQVVYNAPMLALVDVPLSSSGSASTAADQFTKSLAAIRPYLGAESTKLADGVQKPEGECCL